MALTWESQGKLLRINNVTSSKKKNYLKFHHTWNVGELSGRKQTMTKEIWTKYQFCITSHFTIMYWLEFLWDFDFFLVLPRTIETGSANGIFQTSPILGVVNRMQSIGCNSEAIRWILMPVWGEWSLGFLFESRIFQHLQTLVGHV